MAKVAALVLVATAKAVVAATLPAAIADMAAVVARRVVAKQAALGAMQLQVKVAGVVALAILRLTGMEDAAILAREETLPAKREMGLT